MNKVKLLLLSFVALFIVACDAEFCQDLAIGKTEVKTKANWQKQVEYAQRKNRLTKSSADDILLIGYTYRGMIESEKQISEVVEQMFADNAEIAMYLDSVNYKILSMKMIKQIPANVSPLISFKSQIADKIKIGMSVIDLKWSYKGKTVNSIAISSDEEGIIYDHVGCNIVSKKDQLPEVSSVKSLKTRSESDNIREVSTDFGDSRSNSYGTVLWEYRIYCTSSFDGAGILRNRTYYAPHRANNGWNCDAQIKVIGGEINQSTYCEYAWAWAYSNGMSFSITWNGSSFTIPSGVSAGNSGNIVHRR